MNNKLTINKKLLLGSFAIAGFLSYTQAAQLDVYGHLGIHAQTNLDKHNKSNNYGGLSGSVGVNTFFSNGIAMGVGGWAGIPIWSQKVGNDKNTDNIYKDIFVLSDLYFAYTGSAFSLALGRYDVNNMGYDWFSGHNQGLSLSFDIGNTFTIWGLYSHQQAFQFQRLNRESASQISALWNYKGHAQVDSNGTPKDNKGHLAALGVDVKIGDIFRITPYGYYATNLLWAAGITSKLTLGEHTGLYSDTTLKYAYVKPDSSQSGSLIWGDQEFGYKWFKVGGGYYKTMDNGVSGLTYFGDDSRFYGGIVTANFINKAVGEYFGKEQAAWYVFTGARHNMFKFDILYAGGDYEEFSALLSITLFQHLEFGAGYVDLANIANNKRNYVTGFVKAIW